MAAGDESDPCKVIDRCPMNLKEGIGNTFKKHYCWGNYDNCARHSVLTTVGGEFVPITLLPNMMGEAQEIIKENGG